MNCISTIKIISMVEAYLGHKIAINSLQVFWNFGKTMPDKLTQLWHRDPNEKNGFVGIRQRGPYICKKIKKN